MFELLSLDGSNGFRVSGAAEHDFSGMSVSDVGDVNGDGFDDIAIGAFNAFSGGGDIGTGGAYLLFGSSSGFAGSFELSHLNGTKGVNLKGVHFSDRAGTSVSGAGDVNGDGFDDIIIGAPGADFNGKDSGTSYVVLGRASFAPDLDLSTLDGRTGLPASL